MPLYLFNFFSAGVLAMFRWNCQLDFLYGVDMPNIYIYIHTYLGT